MSAQRKAIRNGLKTYLTGKTAAGSRIYTSRAEAIFQAELPLLLIYTRDEAVEEFNTAPRRYKRTMNVQIEAVVEANDAVDDALDDIGAQIENALFENDLLIVSGVELASDSTLTQAELDVLSVGEKNVGVLRTSWDFVYYQDAPAENFGPVDAFEEADLDWKLDGEIAAQDKIELEQP